MKKFEETTIFSVYKHPLWGMGIPLAKHYSNQEEKWGKKTVSDFFDTDYHWWTGIYDYGHEKRFLGYEMCKRREVVVDLVLSLAEKHTHLLDCGCGPGGIVKEIADAVHKIAGIDLNFGFLRQALVNLNSKANLVQANVEELPFPDENFDLILCVGVLSYLKRDEQALREMKRVLRPGGYLILAMPNLVRINFLLDPYYYFLGVWKYLARNRKQDNATAFDKSMIRRYRYGYLKSIFRRFDFIQKAIIGVGFGPFTILKRPIVPLLFSIRISEFLQQCSRWRTFSLLNIAANHWVFCLQKELKV